MAGEYPPSGSHQSETTPRGLLKPLQPHNQEVKHIPPVELTGPVCGLSGNLQQNKMKFRNISWNTMKNGTNNGYHILSSRKHVL